jgi:hypothetical protein
VDAVANVSTQSPFAATAMVTPVALSTTALHTPLDTVAALAELALIATGTQASVAIPKTVRTLKR